MCSEFILALIYFCAIFFVNFFLYKLLKSYFFNILYLLRVRNIFKNFKKADNNFICLLYILSKQEKTNSNYLKNLNTNSNIKDILIIGNTFFYLSKNFKEKKNNNFYYSLLRNQYLNK